MQGWAIQVEVKGTRMNTRMICQALLFTAMTALVVLPARGQSGSTRPTSIPKIRVMIAAIDEIDVPAREAGVIKVLGVEMGTRVQKGQQIGGIDDLDAQARLKAAMSELEAAQAQAESEASVKEAQAMVEIAEAEYENSKEIDKQLDDAVSRFELRRLEATAKRARYRAEVARVDQHVAQLALSGRAAALERVQYELERRKIIAPIDGVVVRKFRDAGEWVNAGDPVVQLVRMDRLRAEALVMAEDFTPQELMGAEVKLTVPIKRGVTRQVVAKITFVSPQVSAGGRFAVFAEFDNPQENGYWMIRPGMNAEAELVSQR